MTPNLIPILVSKQDAEEGSQCKHCGYPFAFGDKAWLWHYEAHNLLACHGDSQVCQLQLSAYVDRLLYEAEEMIPTQGELT